MNTKQQTWKPIKHFETSYLISPIGEVKSIKRKQPKLLKPDPNKHGYLRVCLYSEGKGSRFLVHRLVAKAYIDNPKNLPHVDHKDRVRSHNKKNNLRWVSVEDNLKRRQYAGRT